jgi:hypothetical protein
MVCITEINCPILEKETFIYLLSLPNLAFLKGVYLIIPYLYYLLPVIQTLFYDLICLIYL